MILPQFSNEVLLIGKAILLSTLGVLIGFIAKYTIRIAIDKGILKKLLKDPSTYDTGVLINRVFTEILFWIILIAFFNYAITMLGFNFLNKGLGYILTNIPKIAIFIIIIIAGIMVSKIIVSRIKEQNIENKQEITTLTELIIISAFLLTALEFIGVKATALLLLYSAILLIISVILILLIINPKFLEKTALKKSQPEENHSVKSPSKKK